MAADAETGALKRKIDRVLEGIARGHQRGGAEAARIVQLGDGPVHTRRKPEVVCVDEKALHSREQSTNRGRACV